MENNEDFTGVGLESVIIASCSATVKGCLVAWAPRDYTECVFVWIAVVFKVPSVNLYSVWTHNTAMPTVNTGVGVVFACGVHEGLADRTARNSINQLLKVDFRFTAVLNGNLLLGNSGVSL